MSISRGQKPGMTQPFSFFEEWRGAIFNTIFTALCVVELFFYMGRRLGRFFFETAIGGAIVRAKRVWRAQRVRKAGARSAKCPLPTPQGATTSDGQNPPAMRDSSAQRPCKAGARSVK